MTDRPCVICSEQPITLTPVEIAQTLTRDDFCGDHWSNPKNLTSKQLLIRLPVLAEGAWFTHEDVVGIFQSMAEDARESKPGLHHIAFRTTLGIPRRPWFRIYSGIERAFSELFPDNEEGWTDVREKCDVLAIIERAIHNESALSGPLPDYRTSAA